MNVKKTLAVMAGAVGSSLLLAGTANAALVLQSQCQDSQLSGAGVTVTACSGWWQGNLDGGGSHTADQLAAIQMLPGEGSFSGAGGGNFDISENSSGQLTLPAADALQNGTDIIGFHVGAAKGQPGSIGGEGTAFFKVTVTGGPVTNLTLNVPGLSNAEIFVNGSIAVPEPATWALMLFGVGAIGATMRAARRTTLSAA